MTTKNSAKSAARARQSQFGGKYESQLRHVVGAAPDEGIRATDDDSADLQPEARPRDFPLFPDDGFDDLIEDETPAVAKMLHWFFRHFDDPARGVPYNSQEGGYQYTFGEPEEPESVLPDAFPDAEESDLTRAYKIISRYGFEWVRAGLY